MREKVLEDEDGLVRLDVDVVIVGDVDLSMFTLGQVVLLAAGLLLYFDRCVVLTRCNERETDMTSS